MFWSHDVICLLAVPLSKLSVRSSKDDADREAPTGPKVEPLVSRLTRQKRRIYVAIGHKVARRRRVVRSISCTQRHVSRLQRENKAVKSRLTAELTATESQKLSVTVTLEEYAHVVRIFY